MLITVEYMLLGPGDGVSGGAVWGMVPGLGDANQSSGRGLFATGPAIPVNRPLPCDVVAGANTIPLVSCGGIGLCTLGSVFTAASIRSSVVGPARYCSVSCFKSIVSDWLPACHCGVKTKAARSEKTENYN